MKLTNVKINRIFSVVIAAFAIYSLIVVIRDVEEAYRNASIFFDSERSFYPEVIVLAMLLVPVSIATIAYFINSNNRTYLLLLPVIYSLIMFLSYVVCAMLVLIAIWWFFGPKPIHAL